MSQFALRPPGGLDLEAWSISHVPHAYNRSLLEKCAKTADLDNKYCTLVHVFCTLVKPEPMACQVSKVIYVASTYTSGTHLIFMLFVGQIYVLDPDNLVNNVSFRKMYFEH